MRFRFRGRVSLLGLGLILIIAGITLKIPLASNAAAHGAWSLGAGSVALFLAHEADFAFDIGRRSFELDSYDIPLARKAFEKTVELQPDMLWANYQLARVLFVEGKFDEALAAINKELEYHPNNLRALYVRGLIFAYSNNLPAAETDFERFVAWVPTEWAGYNDLAWVLGQRGKYTEAKKVMEEAFIKAKDAETNPWLWNTLGVQELNLAEFQSAARSFEKAEELAAVLTEEEWRAAYPGNNPGTIHEGLEEFQSAIEANLARARVGVQ